MVISSFNLFSLATLVCSSTTKGILVTQTSRLSHLRITGCNESGVEIHLLSPNEMSSDLDSLEVFGNGRGINVISSGYYTRPLTITNSSIHDNYIRSKDLVSNSLGGYGITISGSMVYLGNVAIERNEGDGPGGGILVSSSSFVSGDLVAVVSNKATNGGGIYCLMSNVHVTRLVVENNVASRFGGGIFSSSCQVSMLRSLISTNLAGDSGGGLWIYMGWLNATLVDFLFNVAEIDGGGYLSNQASTWCRDTFWFKNTAQNANGGGLYAKDSTLMMTNTTLMNNSAAVNGGGVYTEGCSVMLWGADVAHQLATQGGGLYSYDSTVIIWYGAFDDNMASIYGGAAYTLITSLIIYNTSVVDNRVSGGDGGGSGSAFYLDGSTLVCTNVTFLHDGDGGTRLEDITCVNSSPNIYQGNSDFFSIPTIKCSYKCTALLVDVDNNQTRSCDPSSSASAAQVVDRCRSSTPCGGFRARRQKHN
eukprot:TRINITY_DN764_c0_g1_i15.p1 TRINITY_DN764_c0_g1~~TRINITY_DN764_c0_g1_i15.p1  ORF type:complete len:477 (+),score=90.53 TRINITY_DN764_c0_g1_i15:101-1531(+)